MNTHLTDATIITNEIILDLGKAIALKAVKGSMRYAYCNIDYLHKDIINDLYHHTESPSEIEDSTWVFGTYNKIN